MSRLSRWSIFSFALILVLLVSAFPLGVVMAEGEESPPTGNQSSAETPISEDLPAQEEDVIPEGTLTVEDVVSQVADEVVVIPLDSNGEIPPLVEAATASALVSGDPIFCPGYAEWGDPACTEPLQTIEDALNNAAAEGRGTIYVAIDYTDFRTEPLTINGSDWSNQFPVLYLIGGVDLSTGKVIGKTALNRPVDVSGFWVIQIENFIISGVEGTALSVNSTDYARVYNSDLSENTEAGLYVAANENAIIADVKAENNSKKSRVSGSFVNITRSDFSGNSTDGGLEIRSFDGVFRVEGDIHIESSKFNNNAGTGLSAMADGSIFMVCSQAMNNTGMDTQFPEVGAGGMYLSAPGFQEDSGATRDGNIEVWCSQAKGNDSYGLVANASGTIYTANNSFINNGLVDFIPLSPNEVFEQTVPCSEICPVCDGKSGGSGLGKYEEERTAEGNTQVVIVKVGEEDGTAEIKPGYSTVFKLYEEQEEKERLVQLTVLPSGSTPSGSSAVYTPLDESTLPAPLPEGASLIPWGFNLSITNLDGSAVETLIGYMMIRFYLPEGFVLPGGMRLVIQYFDPTTSSWTPMSTAVGGGMAYTFASKPGTYVLTTVPIE